MFVSTASGLLARLSELLSPAEAPVTDYPFVDSDVARYHRCTSAPGVDLLDDETWDDIVIPAYSAELARETSIFGQQELHRRLRGGGTADTGRVRALLHDDALRQQLQTACRGLRRAGRVGPCAAPSGGGWPNSHGRHGLFAE